MANLLQATPFLQVEDVGRTVKFFVEMLGFRALFESHDYAYVQREGAAIRLIEAANDATERSSYGGRAFLFYVDVKDVEDVVHEVRPRLMAAGLATGEGPVNQSWGQREWWVSAPEGGLIIFGQGI